MKDKIYRNIHRIGTIFFFLTLMLWPGFCLTAENKPDIEEIVDTIDQLYRAESSHVVMEMEIITPHWERDLKIEAWTKGMDKMLIRILHPKKERGMGTLRIGNEMWNYLPKTEQIMQVPPAMMMGSWMGSDFNNNDLVKEFTFTKDYTFQYTDIENNDPSLYYIKCVPKPDRPIVWDHIITAVDRESYIPKWQKFYDENGKLMHLMNYKDVTNFDSRRVPAVMELVPKTKEGHKTILRYLESEFNVRIRDSVFSLRNLRTFKE